MKLCVLVLVAACVSAKAQEFGDYRCTNNCAPLEPPHNCTRELMNKHVQVATSNENQQDAYFRNYCRQAGQGLSVAECTSDEMSTDWFDKDLNKRYMIWFYRDPISDCRWKIHGRFSTNEYGSVQDEFDKTLKTLLVASAICTPDIVNYYLRFTPRPAPTRAKPTTVKLKVPAQVSAPPTTDGRCPIVVDVRTKLEFEVGGAPCAYRLEIQKDIKFALDVLEIAKGDRTYPVHVYCRTGTRAEQARQILINQAWTNVINSGGWAAGQRADILEMCECRTKTLCPVCGSTKDGLLSCCAADGTWFQLCSNPGLSNIDHTWAEGIQACKCSECGVDSSGKYSCCAFGGSWFNNCGVSGDTKFEHTWQEGTEACESYALTVPTKLFLQPVEENRCPLVIDTRSQAEWDAGHANCAYRLEIHDDPSLESKLFQLALGDRSYPVQLYCRSGNRAGQAQSILQSYGWTNVTNARGWESGDQEDILKLCSFKDCVPPEPPKCPMLIDVRTKLEWDEGHAECAYRLEIHNDPSLEIVVFQLAQGNRKYPIEVHCASGKRAELARQILLKRGWKNVINAGGWTTGQRDTIEKVCDCTEDNNVCPKCGANPKTGKQSCCATGGAWFDKCGDPGNKNFEHTWSDGVNSCAKKSATGTGNNPANTRACSKCGTAKSGKKSCCSPGGSWFKKCGDPGEGAEHTWTEGAKACKKNPGSKPGSDGTPQGTKDSVCPKCGANAKGKKSCCSAGGSWFKKCGDSDKFEHTWSEGTRACAKKAGSGQPSGPNGTPERTKDSVCPKCGTNVKDKKSCCFRGGAWFKKCGDPGEGAEHTWTEGAKACKKNPGSEPGSDGTPQGTKGGVCTKCGANAKGKKSCCFAGGAWFKKCGDSDKFEHTWSEGTRACANSLATTEWSSCPKCGTNDKNKKSCCFRGGAWFRKCGDPGNKKFEHTWSEGVNECKKPIKPGTEGWNACKQCGVLKTEGKLTCCAPGGSWFDKCGSPGDSRYKYTWFDGVKACEDFRPESPKAIANPTFAPPKNVNRACPLVVDVRTQFEWDAGHAKCAHRLELQRDPSLEAQLLVLANGKRNQPVHVYCQVGARGGKARDVLLAKGWTNVINAGGWATLHQDKIKALCECNTKEKPVKVTPPTKTTTCPQCGTHAKTGEKSCCSRGGSWFKACGNEDNPNVAHTWAQGVAACQGATRVVANSDDCRCPMVVDLRTEFEFLASGHARCARRYEIQKFPQLEAEMADLVGGDRTYPVQVYCQVGNRGGSGRKILMEAGWTNVTNAGGWGTDQRDHIESLCDCFDGGAAAQQQYVPPGVQTIAENGVKQVVVANNAVRDGISRWMLILACAIALNHMFD